MTSKLARADLCPEMIIPLPNTVVEDLGVVVRELDYYSALEALIEDNLD